MVSADQLFQQFLRESTYLKNVTRKTLSWYESAWKAFKAAQSDGGHWPVTKTRLQQFVVCLRERGVRPISCKTWLKAMNAYCGWLYEQGHLAQPVSLPSLRVEQRILCTLDDGAIRQLLAFRPRAFPQWRIYTLACTILDTGCRIQELLSARPEDFDFDSPRSPASPCFWLIPLCASTTHVFFSDEAQNRGGCLGRRRRMGLRGQPLSDSGICGTMTAG